MKIYLDLLPEERKRELNRKKRFWIILRQEILFFSPLLVLMVILINIYLVLGIHKDTLIALGSQQQAEEKYKELHSFENKFKEINDSTALISKIQANHLRWTNLISKISELVPDGIYLSELTIKDYRVLLIGKAKSRELLINFKDALSGWECSEGVNVPLSDLVTKNDVDFQIDFLVKPECLKSKR